MKETDDIDILLTLHPHGWSTCWIFVDGKGHEISISHVFGDPYVDCMRALSALMQGQKTSTFYWYGEPGGERIEISRVKAQLFSIHVAGFSESYGSEVSEFHTTIAFEMHEKALLIVVYLQLSKIALRMADKTYAGPRNGDFPFREFKKFEAEVKQYLALSQ